MLKYTAKIGQPQFVGKVKIDPKGGDLTEKQAEEIKADPWGQELIEAGVLKIEGVKAPDKDSDKPAGKDSDSSPKKAPDSSSSADNAKEGQEGK
jgi:hypothetical protein